jgi:hypothetical protein
MSTIERESEMGGVMGRAAQAMPQPEKAAENLTEQVRVLLDWIDRAHGIVGGMMAPIDEKVARAPSETPVGLIAGVRSADTGLKDLVQKLESLAEKVGRL